MIKRFSIKEWLSTTNHKRIGILYIVASITFMGIAGVFGALMRTQLATPNELFLDPFSYDQIVTFHGLLMILWVLSPLGVGLANYIVPLQIGAKDLAFPRLNALSFFTFAFSGILLLGSAFAPGGGPDVGWTFYAPLNTMQFTPQTGVTLAVLAFALLAGSVTISSVNFITTILKSRTKGVTWRRMPIFTWSVLMTNVLMLFAFPTVAAGMLLLSFDRILGSVFFSSIEGGSILWDQLFWFFGHPEVYILVLPAIGIMAEVIQTFARRPLFARTVFLIELGLVAILSQLVWVHHMFTTGVNYNLLETFAITSMAISVPFEGIVIQLVISLRKGRIKVSTPLLFSLLAIFTVVLGGLTGVLQAFPVLDYVFRGTYWVVGHFHYVMAGTTLFGLLAGLYYWWPKITGRTYNERVGIISFILSVIGFNVLYFPYFFLIDMPRRVSTYTFSSGLAPQNFVATIGAFVFFAGSALAVLNLVWSYRRNVTSSSNPWDSKELEWTKNYTGNLPGTPETVAHSQRLSERQGQSSQEDDRAK
ncbi:MAG: cytochrome c oxidase subunit I [Chloroflexota bacterium]|nr:cbb3-type cytochrome c oxidase subunit I [Candidatus Sulfotelmatobacter sp.]